MKSSLDKQAGHSELVRSRARRYRRWPEILAVVAATLLPADGALRAQDSGDSVAGAASDNRIVDCLLPGQVRQLGRRMTYLTPRRPARLPAVECGIRGGEYLLYDRANAGASLMYWTDLAETSDQGGEQRVAAELRVGEIFERGLLGQADYQQALTWYGKAAASGSTTARLKLASMYERGLGTEANPELARKIYAEVLGVAAAPLDPRSLHKVVPDKVALEQQLERERAEQLQLQEKLSATANALDQARGQLAELQARIEARDEQVDRDAEQQQQRAKNALEETVRQARDQVRSYEKRLQQLERSASQLAKLRTELDARDREILALQTRIAGSESDMGNLQVELNRQRADHREALSRLQADLEAATAKDRQQGAEDAQLRRQLQERQAEIDAQRSQIDRVAAALGLQEQDLHNYRQQLAKQEAQQAQAVRLQAELLAQRQANEVLQFELKDVNGQLLQREAQLSAQQAYAESLETRLQYLEQQRIEAGGERTRDRQRLAELEGDIGRQQSLLAEKQSLISELQQSVDNLRREQQQVEERARQERQRLAGTDLAGPDIELIDPPLTATRGIDVVSSAVAEAGVKQLIGRITAPAGILSLTVNDSPEQTNPMGVFRTLIEMNRPTVPVRIVAVDNQGKRNEMLLQLRANREPEAAPDAPVNVDFGKYHALLIGNDQYRDLPDLQTAVHDAEEVGKLLQQRYGFATTVVRNASRGAVFEALYQLHKTLTREDNLLIYYAGHGAYVEGTSRGVWLPVDAHRDNPANWITNIEVSDYLMQIRAKQVLVIVDSCYSGALTRSALAHLEGGKTAAEYRAWLKSMAVKVSRTALTSGGLKPTLDSGGGGHSVFARAVLDVLGNNRSVLAGQDLGQAVSARVVHGAAQLGFPQEPEYAPIDGTGHEGGDFFFVPLARSGK